MIRECEHGQYYLYCNICFEERTEGRQARKCDSGCKYYKFDHLDTACVLSPIYSVKKGKDCYNYQIKLETKKGK